MRALTQTVEFPEVRAIHPAGSRNYLGIIPIVSSHVSTN
jgi:hypothetical protein